LAQRDDDRAIILPRTPAVDKTTLMQTEQLRRYGGLRQRHHLHQFSGPHFFLFQQQHQDSSRVMVQGILAEMTISDHRNTCAYLMEQIGKPFIEIFCLLGQIKNSCSSGWPTASFRPIWFLLAEHRCKASGLQEFAFLSDKHRNNLLKKA